jgi:plastocyanin
VTWRAPRAALAPALSLVFAAALAASAPHEVKMDSIQFSPASLTVQRGDTVTWRNTDPVPHTATAKGKFDSGNIAPGKSWSHRMDLPGEFDYICSYHPGMKGKVTVK